MEEKKFIAISEDEYNSFKHGEYEREIKRLKEQIQKLEKEKEEIAKGKGVILEITDSYSFGRTKTVKLISNETFENEILEAIKNTEFKHVVKDRTIGLFGNFNKENDYIQIGDTYYYQNEWCEKVKRKMTLLSCEVKRLEEKRDKLNVEVAMLDKKLGVDNEDAFSRDSTIIRRIIDKFSK